MIGSVQKRGHYTLRQGPNAELSAQVVPQLAAPSARRTRGRTGDSEARNRRGERPTSVGMLSKDLFICAIVDLLNDRHLERAIASVLEILVDLSNAELAHLELRDDRDVVYARTYRNIIASTGLRDPANVVRRDIGVPRVGELVVVAPKDAEAILDHLDLVASVLATRSDRIIHAAVGRPVPMLHEAVEVFERRYVIEAIQRHRGNMSAAARALGIARSTLYDLVGHVKQ